MKRAPVHKRSKDDIVADIIEIVKIRTAKSVKNARVKLLVLKTTQPLVERLIDDLRKDLPPFTGNRPINEEYARDLRKQIDKLKKTLKRAPQPVSAALFAPEMFFKLAVWQGTMLGINPQTRSYLSQTPKRLALLLEQLNWLRAQCDQIIRIKLGTYKSQDHRKLHAAIASRELLESVDEYTGGKLSPLTVSLTSDYCRIASLFFEAATGRYVGDFRQACETVAPRPLRTKE
jgi:hypothetical protein